MKYDYYLFDFDGTVCDTGRGIRNCTAYTLEKMGRPVPDEATLNRFIGPPLVTGFMDMGGMSEEEAWEATHIYRAEYRRRCIFEADLYPGITNLLRELKKAGAYVAVASAKPIEMLEIVLPYFGINDFLDAYVGPHGEGKSADKRAILKEALPEGADPARCCMIGDREYDLLAGRSLGMATAAAMWGYAPEGELEACNADHYCENVAALTREMLGDTVPQGAFITFEGSDGCGKSTHIERTREYLKFLGYDTVLTREPGGSPVAEQIRETILDVNNTGMSPTCEALLYAASRAEHIEKTILPALRSGKVVISDRFLDSSIAYQAFGRELNEDFVRLINRKTEDVRVDGTIMLRLDRGIAKTRVDQTRVPDRIERENEPFFARVEAGLTEIARREPDRVRQIDASRPVEEVSADVKRTIREILK